MPANSPASHRDLAARNAAFKNKAGKKNPLNKVEVERKAPVPKWLALSLLALVGGGLIFELVQLIFNNFFATPTTGGKSA